jgi:hypothetical protein
MSDFSSGLFFAQRRKFRLVGEHDQKASITDDHISAEGDLNTIYSPAAYRREAPIRGCLYKKLLDLFCKNGISLERKESSISK